MRDLVNSAFALLLLIGVESCIPIESDLRTVHYSTVGSGQYALDAGESIAILGRSTSDDMAGCVRDTLSRNAPGVRFFAPEGLMQAAGAVTGSNNKVLSDQDVERLIQQPEVQRLAAEQALRYVFLVEGKTFDSESSLASGGAFGAITSNKNSRAAAHLWDVASGQYLGEVVAASFGETGIMGPVPNLWLYAPTESEACKALADNISGFLTSGKARSDVSK